ncbi:N-acetyltransferase eso1, partial [Dimargaris verticillata]
MTVDEAKKMCPNIRLVHVATYKSGCSTYAYHSDPAPTSHKVSLDPYRHASARILRIFQQHCSIVQKASV